MPIERPTVPEIRVILKSDLTDDALLAILEDAVLIVEQCLTPLDGPRQKAILKYIVAHLVSGMTSLGAQAGAAVTSKSIGDASESYAVPTLTGVGLSSSSYGLQAIMLDPNGCLSNLGLRKIKMRSL